MPPIHDALPWPTPTQQLLGTEFNWASFAKKLAKGNITERWRNLMRPKEDISQHSCEHRIYKLDGMQWYAYIHLPMVETSETAQYGTHLPR